MGKRLTKKKAVSFGENTGEKKDRGKDRPVRGQDQCKGGWRMGRKPARKKEDEESSHGYLE